MGRRFALLSVAAAVALSLTGCSKKALTPPKQPLSSRCSPAPTDVVGGLQRRLSLPEGATMRNFYVLESKDPAGVWFVSGELVKKGRAKDPGEVLTWETSRPPTAQAEFVAIDDATKYGSWPAGDRTIFRFNDPVINRSCVDHDRPR